MLIHLNLMRLLPVHCTQTGASCLVWPIAKSRFMPFPCISSANRFRRIHFERGMDGQYACQNTHHYDPATPRTASPGRRRTYFGGCCPECGSHFAYEKSDDPQRQRLLQNHPCGGFSCQSFKHGNCGFAQGQCVDDKGNDCRSRWLDHQNIPICWDDVPVNLPTRYPTSLFGVNLQTFPSSIARPPLQMCGPAVASTALTYGWRFAMRSLHPAGRRWAC